MTRDDNWTQSRVLVTGASGFVGSSLVAELLELGASVIALVRNANPQSELFRTGNINRITVVNGTLEDFSTLERTINKHEVDTVLHLGAQAIVGTAHRFPLHTFETNIRGTYNILEACRLHSDLVKRVVIASSDKVYGQQPELPYTEEMSLSGQFPYEVSKSCADLIAQAYHHTYGLTIGIARCCNVYGGGDLNWNRIVPGTIRSFLEGKCPVIRSDGSYVRDYIYVKDAARAYISLAGVVARDDVRGQAFNFSSEAPVTVLELVEEIQSLMRCSHLKPEIVDTAQGEIHSQHLSAAKARRVLGWRPQYDLATGLRDTVDWCRDYLAG